MSFSKLESEKELNPGHCMYSYHSWFCKIIHTGFLFVRFLSLFVEDQHDRCWIHTVKWLTRELCIDLFAFIIWSIPLPIISAYKVMTHYLSFFFFFRLSTVHLWCIIVLSQCVVRVNPIFTVKRRYLQLKTAWSSSAMSSAAPPWRC